MMMYYNARLFYPVLRLFYRFYHLHPTDSN